MDRKKDRIILPRLQILILAWKLVIVQIIYYNLSAMSLHLGYQVKLLGTDASSKDLIAAFRIHIPSRVAPVSLEEVKIQLAEYIARPRNERSGLFERAWSAAISSLSITPGIALPVLIYQFSSGVKQEYKHCVALMWFLIGLWAMHTFFGLFVRNMCGRSLKVGAVGRKIRSEALRGEGD